jgi:hypothetical protein
MKLRGFQLGKAVAEQLTCQRKDLFRTFARYSQRAVTRRKDYPAHDKLVSLYIKGRKIPIL